MFRAEHVETAIFLVIMIVPFTSAPRAVRFPGTLLIQPDTQNGLSLPSIALVFQLSAVDKRNCLQRLGALDVQSLDQIFALMDKLMGR